MADLITLCPPPPPPRAVIILSILEVIIILLLIFLRKRILIAIALIKEASRWVPGCQGVRLGWSQGCSGLDVCVSAPPRAVGYVMCSLLYPLVTFFLLCLCIAYWASTAMYPPSDPDLRPRGWGLSATLAWR